MAVRPQPAPLLPVVRQELGDQAPERRLVVAVAQMAELVHDHIVEHGRRRQDQAPVEVDHVARRAAAPERAVRLDREAARHAGRGAARSGRSPPSPPPAPRAAASRSARARPRSPAAPPAADPAARRGCRRRAAPAAASGRSAPPAGAASRRETGSWRHRPAGSSPHGRQAFAGSPRAWSRSSAGCPRRRRRSRHRASPSGATTSTPAGRTVMRSRLARPLRRI